MKISEAGLFEILADGQFHSGQELADSVGVSRAAVWKHLASIRAKGAGVVAVRGRGYRLESPADLLDAKLINRYLEPATTSLLQNIEIHYQLDSTNCFLRDRLTIGTIHANVVFAEYQTAGRGRGSNQWLAAPGSGLCLSIGWHFESTPRNLSALSLATGVVLADCLAQFGPQPVRLKWPNDLVYSGAKLGGILIESRGQLAGTVDVIIGIGINVDLPSDFAKGIAQDVTDLKHVYGCCPSRNLLAGSIINGMFRLLGSYGRRGFEAYMEKWRDLDITRDRMVVLRQAAGDVTGRVVDIDENGFLILSVNGTLSRYSSGELSLRMAT